MTKINLSNAELEKALTTQLQFLKNSAAAFDEGFIDEAVRMACTIRILLHQTRTSHAVLEQLGKLNSTYFTETSGGYQPGNLLATHNLVLLKSDGTYCAPLDCSLGKPAFVTFEKWWNEIVLANVPMTMSRKTLTLTAANQDGGAHVDPGLNEEYHSMKSGPAWWVATDESGNETPVEAVHLHSIRQIAHEVIISLDRSYPLHYLKNFKNMKTHRTPKG